MASIDVTFEGLRTWQHAVWDSWKRHNVIVAHRRSGKTVLAIIWLIWRVAPTKNGHGAYISPFYSQSKRVAWPYLKRYAGLIPGTVFNEAELKATFVNGASIILLGSDNAHAIRGIGLDAVVMDEVAQIGPDVWFTVVRPALADRQGHSLFIGTPFGRGNQFYDTWRDAEGKEDWSRSLWTHEQTGAIAPDEIKALKREMSPEAFDQEFNCSFDAAIRGAFYGAAMAAAESAGRVGKVPHDPALPVHTSWDLGISDATVVWFWQVNGSEVRAIECQAWQSKGLPEIVRDLKSKPYTYGTHTLPHDAKVRELGSGKSRLEILLGLGIAATLAPDTTISDGIEATRVLLPRVWFDREGCGLGIEALKTYRTEWDDTKRVFKSSPLHSWEADYADSARYFAVSAQGKHQGFQPLDYSRYDRAVI